MMQGSTPLFVKPSQLASPQRALPNESAWNGWVLNTRNLTLVRPEYEIDLESVTDSASLLDWIFQVQMKSWCTPEVLSGLLAACAEIFEPQENLCSFGIDKRIKPAEFLASRLMSA